MKCPNCGKEIDDNVKECPYCRKKLTETNKKKTAAKRKANQNLPWLIGFCVVILFAIVGVVFLIIGVHDRNKEKAVKDTADKSASSASLTDGTDENSAGTATASEADEDPDKIIQDMKDKYTKFVTIGEYKDIVYTPTDATVTDADVQKKINILVDNATKYNHITNRKAKKGDVVHIDYVGTVDGKTFDGGSTNEQGIEIELGKSGYVDGFDDQIIGHKAKDVFNIKVTFPKDYKTKSLAGKKAVFKTTLDYISEEVDATYTDALVKDQTSYNSKKEFEAATRTELMKDAEKEAASEDRQAVISAAVSKCSVKDYPSDELNERKNTVITGIKNRASASDMDYDEMLKNMYGVTEDQFNDQLDAFVKNYLKEKMVMVAIADKENITVTKADKEAVVKNLLEEKGLSTEEELKENYGYSSDDYYLIVLENKVYDILKKSAVANK